MAQYQGGKRMIPIYIDESIYREIKVYAASTDQSFQQVIKTESAEFEQTLLKVVTTIKEMRRKAEEEIQKIEEEKELVAQYPMRVAGHEVDPLGTELEQPVTA